MAIAKNVWRYGDSARETSSGRKALVVTPSDTLDLVEPGAGDDGTNQVPCRRLWVGAGGAGLTLSLILADHDTPVLFTGVLTGTMLELAVRRVLTASTASLIVAIW